MTPDRVAGVGRGCAEAVHPVQADEERFRGGRGDGAGDEAARVDPEDLPRLDALVQLEAGVLVDLKSVRRRRRPARVSR